jgi:hypothetical protein
MADSKVDERFDDLVSQVHDWTESAVALDEGHFPSELLSDLRDLISDLKEYLDEEGEGRRDEVLESFATPEMAEVVQRFPKVRRLLEGAWGSTLTEMLEEEQGFVSDEDDEDD